MSPLLAQHFTLANSQPQPQGESSFSVKAECWHPLLRLLSLTPMCLRRPLSPLERAASLVVLDGWHSHALTGIRDVKEPQARDPQQPLHEHCEC